MELTVLVRLAVQVWELHQGLPCMPAVFLDVMGAAQQVTLLRVSSAYRPSHFR